MREQEDTPRDRRKNRRATRGALALLGGLALLELRKPPAARTWHGPALGVVPYDLRPPTPARVRGRWWNPDDPRLFTPQVFGLGWAVNLGRLARLLGIAGTR